MKRPAANRLPAIGFVLGAAVGVAIGGAYSGIGAALGLALGAVAKWAVLRRETNTMR